MKVFLFLILEGGGLLVYWEVGVYVFKDGELVIVYVVLILLVLFCGGGWLFIVGNILF